MSLPSYHVSTPSGSVARPPPVDAPFDPPSPSSSFRSLMGSSSTRPRTSIPVPPEQRANVLHADDDCVVFLERERALASAGHLTVLIAPPRRSVYDFAPSDVSLLVRLLSLARELLNQHGSSGEASSASPAVPRRPSATPLAQGRGGGQADEPPASPLSPTMALPVSPTPLTTSFPPPALGGGSRLRERIGFVSTFKDPLNPSSPYLTLHATLGPLDRAGWWTRTGPFGPAGFYALDDLIAEIRESTSNNRIRSGEMYATPAPTSSAFQTARYTRPIDRAPQAAGSRWGDANGAEYTSAAAASTAPAPAAAGGAQGSRAGDDAPSPNGDPKEEEDMTEVVLEAKVDKGKGREVV